MTPQTSALATVAALILCSAASSAVLPLDPPTMAVRVEAGEYAVRGHAVKVPLAVELPIAAPENVRVTNEEHVLSEEKPAAYHKGTALKKTLGPVDKFTRLPMAIDPDSVRVHSAAEGGTVYEVFLQRVDVVQLANAINHPNDLGHEFFAATLMELLRPGGEMR